MDEYEQDLMRKNYDEKKLIEEQRNTKKALIMPGTQGRMSDKEFYEMERRKLVPKKGRFNINTMI